MAISAETLNVILKAKDKDFARQMERNERRVNKFSKNSNKSLKSTTAHFNKLGSAASSLGLTLSTGALVAGVALMVNNATLLAKEINNLAAISGTGVERFQELAFASRTVGIEQEKLADILKDVNDKFGDYAATGAGPLADFFDIIAPKVGITQKAFEGLSSDIKTLQKAGVSQQEMTFFMEALASDATALTPLFYNNAAAMDELAQSANDLGVVIDQSLVQGAVEMRDRWDQVMASMTAKFTNFALTVVSGFDAIFNISEQEQMRELGQQIDALGRDRQQLSEKLQQVMTSPNAPAGAREQVLGRLAETDTQMNQLLSDNAAIVDNLETRIGLEQKFNDLQAASNSGLTETASNVGGVATAARTASVALEEVNEFITEAGPLLTKLGIEAEAFNGIMGTVESSMETAFMSMIDGTSSASDAFRAMASDIVKELYRVLVVKQLTGFISGAISGALTNTVAVPAVGRASGGSVMGGQSYMVGEHGREPFIPSQNGRILSTAQAKDAMSGGGPGVTVIQNNTFGNGVNRAEINAMLPKLVEASKAAVYDAQRRSVNGR